MKMFWSILKRFAADETGLSTVEVLLILVCLITLVIIFREEMIDIVESVFDEITKKIKKITIKSNTITDVGEGAFAGYNKNLVIEVNKGYVEYYKEILKDIFDFNIVTIKEIE